MANIMISSLIQQQDRGMGSSFTNLGQSIKKLTGTNKAQLYKKAGQKLFELGGISEKNLKVVIKMFDLGPEEVKELVSTFQTLASFIEKNRAEVPLDPQTLKAFSEKIGFPFKEGSTLKNIATIAETLPKEKEWGSKFLESETGAGQFFSDRPGTLAPKGFRTPESIRGEKSLAQGKLLAMTRATKAAEEKQTEKQTKQKTAIKNSLEKAIASYERAVLGLDQFIPSENNAQVAQQEQQRIQTLAEQYTALGGKLENLGVKSLETLKKWFSGEKKPIVEKEEPSGITGYLKNLFGKKKETEEKKKVYVNPKTGEKIYWDGKQWQPMN